MEIFTYVYGLWILKTLDRLVEKNPCYGSIVYPQSHPYGPLVLHVVQGDVPPS